MQFVCLIPQLAPAAALAVLLEANGYSSSSDAADGGSSRPSEITTLEMFLQDYPKVLLHTVTTWNRLDSPLATPADHSCSLTCRCLRCRILAPSQNWAS